MKNNPSIFRSALWITLAFVLFINYLNWQKDYAAVDAAAAAAREALNQPVIGNLDAVTATTGGGSAPSGAATAAMPAGALGAAPAALGSGGAGNAIDAANVVQVNTDVLNVTLSLRGGTVIQVDLPMYARVKGKPERVRLQNHDSPDTEYLLQTGLVGPAGAERPSQQATFTAAQSSYQLADGQDELRVPLTWTDGHGVTVTKEFVLRRGSYKVEVNQVVQNQSDADWVAVPFAQIMRNHIPEKTSFFNPNPERFATNGPAIWDGSSYRVLKLNKQDDAHLSIPVTTGWISALQHHFVTAVVPPAGEPFRFTMQAQGNEYALAATGAQAVVPAGGRVSLPLTVFVGPKLQAQLAGAGPQLARVTDFGRFYVIAQPLYKGLSWVHSMTGNWGVAILIVTLMIKLAFYPLSEYAGRSAARMRELAPRIKNLQEQYKDDREKLARSTMELYRKEGANPATGCLPMVIQMPVFFAYYWVLNESVEMRQAPFMGWLQDLSAPDPFYILPVLMASAMFVQQRLMPMPTTDPVQAKVMMFMPIFMSVLFVFLPQGLVLYYVANTVLGVLQQWNINRRIHAAALARKRN